MKFKISRESLVKPLQSVMSAIDARSTLPILSNVLLVVEGNTLTLTGSNLEVEQISTSPDLLEVTEPGRITVPAKKLLDISKALPDGSVISLDLDGDNMLVKSGKSKFKLGTLSANDFPNIGIFQPDLTASVPSALLSELISSVAFSMADQDVRYYLNGMLFEFHDAQFRTVSTDGHRLSMREATLPIAPEGSNTQRSAIVPKKSVLDLLKALSERNIPEYLQISMNQNMMRIEMGHQIMTTKLIDGRFPDYRRVIPRELPLRAEIDRLELKNALVRVNILSNEKFRGAEFHFEPKQLACTARNPNDEQAEEVVSIQGPAQLNVVIGFNIGYVLDILNTLKSEMICVQLSDGNNSAVIQSTTDGGAIYVVMPMRL